MGQGDYVLSTYHYSFTNACLRYAQHKPYFWIFLVVLIGKGVHGNICYMHVSERSQGLSSAAQFSIIFAGGKTVEG